VNRERLFNGSRNEDGSRDYKLAFIDAVITAGFTFFSTLGGLGAAGLLSDPKEALIVAGISTGIAFFASLMTSLQIKKPTGGE
jgi:hypothetical protein